MGFLRRMKKFYQLNFDNKKLMVEVLFLLGIHRILILFPFSWLSPYLGTSMKETPFRDVERNIELMSISQAIEIVSNHTPWESKCLVQALTAMRILSRRKITSTLYLGVSKNEEGKMIAHAWIRSGNFYVTGAYGKDDFTTIGIFSNIMNENDEGDPYENGIRI